MFYDVLKKRLKRKDSVIEVISEKTEENCLMADCEEQKTGEKKVLEEVDEKTIEMSRSLMVYIGKAIDKWAQEYNMERLPRKIVFKKALVLMNLWGKMDSFK